MRIIIFTLLCCATLSYIISGSSQVKPIPNCFITLENGQCSECSFGFTLRNGVCVQGMRNCKTYDPKQGVCTSCYVGYSLNRNSACVVNSKADLMVGCSSKFQNTCLSCKQGFYFNWDGNCEPLDPLCLRFNYRTKTCQACNVTYAFRMNQGKCIPYLQVAKRFDYACTSFVGENQCKSCQNGFYLAGMCLVANSNCRTADPNNPLHCYTCFYPYVLSGNTCVAVNQNPLCKEYGADGTCSSCLFRAFKNPLGICTAVNPVCQTHDENGYCLTCYPGYTLSNSTCVQSSLVLIDPLCELWVGNKCAHCSMWSFFDRFGRCQRVNSLCRNAEYDSGECMSCYGGWQRTYTGTCVPAVSKPCKQFTNNGTCKACSDGFTYDQKDGLCVIDLQPCARKDSAGNCLKCFPGYYLNNNAKCTMVDPLCADYNPATKLCYSCYGHSSLRNGKCVRTK